MTTRDDRDIDPRDPSFYGERYYARDLHHGHWFKDNEAKRHLRLRTIIELLRLAPTDRLLDLGCADGAHSMALKPLVAEITGIDFSEVAIRIARERSANMAGVRFLRADVADLSCIETESIDKVAAIDLVEHIDDHTLENMLRETWRVLRPGGRLAFYTPCATHYVERLKARGVLKQLPGHIAVRDAGAYGHMLQQLPWREREIMSLPSSYPVFGRIDRFMMKTRWLGPFFQFRIVGAVSKP
jgi:cyclopropane fatty-acyl-phospholipid synthase-like methyltransferase